MSRKHVSKERPAFSTFIMLLFVGACIGMMFLVLSY